MTAEFLTAVLCVTLVALAIAYVVQVQTMDRWSGGDEGEGGGNSEKAIAIGTVVIVFLLWPRTEDPSYLILLIAIAMLGGTFPLIYQLMHDVIKGSEGRYTVRALRGKKFAFVMLFFTVLWVITLLAGYRWGEEYGEGWGIVVFAIVYGMLFSGTMKVLHELYKHKS